MDTVWLMLWKGRSGCVLLLHLAHCSPTCHYGYYVIDVFLLREIENSRKTAMFSLILAVFYFMLDINSVKKSPVSPCVFLYIKAVCLIIWKRKRLLALQCQALKTEKTLFFLILIVSGIIYSQIHTFHQHMTDCLILVDWLTYITMSRLYHSVVLFLSVVKYVFQWHMPHFNLGVTN